MTIVSDLQAVLPPSSSPKMPFPFSSTRKSQSAGLNAGNVGHAGALSQKTSVQQLRADARQYAPRR